jgi:hypothetical protein
LAFESNQQTVQFLPIPNRQEATDDRVQTILDEEEEDLNQEFNNTFLDRAFATEEESNTHMEMDLDPKNVHPPLEEFTKNVQAENYWDSDDERELEWTDILPDIDNISQSGKEKRNVEKDQEKKGRDSPWTYPFHNKFVSVFLGFCTL